MDDLHAAPYSADPIMDAASDLDRAYFDRHPDEAEYVRLALPGELPMAVGWVRVVQLAPGVRARAPWTPADRGGAR